MFVDVFKFTSKEEVEKIIISALDTVEEHEKTHLLPREEVYKVIDEITKTPFGYAEGNGGIETNYRRYSGVKTTYFVCAWYSKNKKHIYLKIERTLAIRFRHSTRYSRSGRIILDNKSKEIAYKTVFPERYSTYTRIKKLRSIRHLRLPQPPSRLIRNIMEGGGGVTAATFEDIPYVWIGTPAGWFETKSYNINRNAWLYLKDLGFPVPSEKSKRVWNDKMEAYAKAYAIINKI